MGKPLLWATGFVVAAAGAAIIGFGLVMKLEFRTRSRTLNASETHQTVKDLTGRDLPVDTKSLHGIYIYNRTIDSDEEHVFVTFEAGPEAQVYMLETFGKEHATEFPDKEGLPADVFPFLCEIGLIYQERLDAALFDEDLLHRIKEELMDGLMTGVCPSDAVRGLRIESRADSGTICEVLIFAEQNLVYLTVLRDNWASTPRRPKAPKDSFRNMRMGEIPAMQSWVLKVSGLDF